MFTNLEQARWPLYSTGEKRGKKKDKKKIDKSFTILVIEAVLPSDKGSSCGNCPWGKKKGDRGKNDMKAGEA